MLDAAEHPAQRAALAAVVFREWSRYNPHGSAMYEHSKGRLLPWEAFLWRLAKHAGLALAVVVFSLGAGMAGYVYFERLSWLDGFLNAAMLLGGMGPVETPQTPGGKLFAGM